MQRHGHRRPLSPRQNPFKANNARRREASRAEDRFKAGAEVALCSQGRLIHSRASQDLLAEGGGKCNLKKVPRYEKRGPRLALRGYCVASQLKLTYKKNHAVHSGTQGNKFKLC